MRRRDFLRFLLATPIATQLDVEKLLWVPEKTIFLPSYPSLTMSQIVAAELERVLPYVKDLFERDDVFFREISKRKVEVVSNRSFQLPITYKS